jgi:hypothetical protein
MDENSDSSGSNSRLLNKFVIRKAITKGLRNISFQKIFSQTALSTIDDREKISFREPPTSPGGTLQVSDLLFVDAKETGISGILEVDVPDPDILSVENETRGMASMDSQFSILSLPRNRQFRTPTFRSVPSFLNISESTIACTIFYLSITICVVNVAFNIYGEATKMMW